MATVSNTSVKTLGTTTPASPDQAGFLALNSSLTIAKGTVWGVCSATNIHSSHTEGFSDLQIEETNSGTVLFRKAYLGLGSDETAEDLSVMSNKIGPFSSDTSVRAVLRNAIDLLGLGFAGLVKIYQIPRSANG